MIRNGYSHGRMGLAHLFGRRVNSSFSSGHAEGGFAIVRRSSQRGTLDDRALPPFGEMRHESFKRAIKYECVGVLGGATHHPATSLNN